MPQPPPPAQLTALWTDVHTIILDAMTAVHHRIEAVLSEPDVSRFCHNTKHPGAVACKVLRNREDLKIASSERWTPRVPKEALRHAV